MQRPHVKNESRDFKNMFRYMFSLHHDKADSDTIYDTIVAGARLQGTNMCVLILAILIASIGLNMNSTAVIIGAMLISPLMGSITAIGYGIATCDLLMARRAAVKLGVQVIICILTSTIYFAISPIKTASSELLARTSPTIWDVLIATCGGFAGIIGQTRKEKSNVLPGVAIATALMPPLCTAGYGLARLRWDYFGGAMYLFFINGFFICLAALLTVKYLGLPHNYHLTSKQLRKIHRQITIIAIITILPSIFLAYNIVMKTVDSGNADKYLSEKFKFTGTQVVQQEVDTDKKTISVALIGKKITDAETLALENELKTYSLSDYTLNITQTEVESGVTEEELKKILKDNETKSSKENQLSQIIAEKTNKDLASENEKLSSELEAENPDLNQLKNELHALYPQVEAVKVTHTEASTDSSDTDKSMKISLSVSKKLAADKLTAIKRWLETKYENRIIVLSQTLSK